METEDNTPVVGYSVEYDAWNGVLKKHRKLFADIIARTLDTGYGKPPVPFEISIVLTDDKSIRKLNREYRYKDKPTNVLSFPQIEDFDEIDTSMPSVSLGDIIIAYETVEREAAEQEISFENHTAHMICHGLLHLLGYDHIDDGEAEEMENLEIKILHDAGITSPYN